MTDTVDVPTYSAAEVTTPAQGVNLFLDSADGLLKYRDASGALVVVGSGGASGLSRAAWKSVGLYSLGPGVTLVNFVTSPDGDAEPLKGTGLDISNNLILGNNDGFEVTSAGQGWWLQTIHVQATTVPDDVLLTIAPPLIHTGVPTDPDVGSYVITGNPANAGHSFTLSYLMFLAEGAATALPAAALFYDAIANIALGDCSIQMVQLSAEDLT